jgi:hypothetical protein
VWLAEKLGQPATTSGDESGRDSGNNDSLRRTGDRLNGTTAVEWHSNVFETSIMFSELEKIEIKTFNGTTPILIDAWVLRKFLTTRA